MDQDSLKYDNLNDRPLPQWLINQRDSLNTIQPQKIIMKDDRSLYLSSVVNRYFCSIINSSFNYIYSPKEQESKTMNPFLLVIKELLHRKISSAIILFTVIVASSVSVAIYTLSKASEDETRKIMREQGLNLYLFPKGTNLIDFYSVNNTATFPESYVDVLSDSKTFDAVRHLTGILQLKYPDWKDANGSSHQIVLIGYKDEAMQRFLPKQETMGFDVAKGTVQVGAPDSKKY